MGRGSREPISASTVLGKSRGTNGGSPLSGILQDNAPRPLLALGFRPDFTRAGGRRFDTATLGSLLATSGPLREPLHVHGLSLGQVGDTTELGLLEAVAHARPTLPDSSRPANPAPVQSRVEIDTSAPAGEFPERVQRDGSRRAQSLRRPRRRPPGRHPLLAFEDNPKGEARADRIRPKPTLRVPLPWSEVLSPETSRGFGKRALHLSPYVKSRLRAVDC